MGLAIKQRYALFFVMIENETQNVPFELVLAFVEEGKPADRVPTPHQ
jgi:hypothetical protein